MIRHISIENFAIIKNINIDFTSGFSTITGETGAGKSIIIEAITMALGDRADRTFVRTGEEKAVIQIIVDLNGVENILYREISKDGKNLCKINGEIVTLAFLREYSKQIADIHGQYSHQSLLDIENHVNLLDSFMNDEILPQKNKVSILFSEFSELSKQYRNILSSINSNKVEKDYMEYQLEEINKIDPKENEDEILLENIKILENKEKIYGELEKSYTSLYEDEHSILGQLMKISKSLESLNDIYDSSEALSSQCLDAYYSLESLSQNLRDAKESIPSSDVSLDSLIERYESIESLKRKHGGSLKDVMDFKEKAILSLSSSENREELINEILNKKNICENKLKEASYELTNKRKKISVLLEEKITEELKDLNFKDASIQIQIEQKKEYTSNGIDNIEFLIKTNKGDTYKPLVKIASGGEMSRIMLAFKNISSKYDNIPTIIFDEIDSGISGQTASIVGKKLKEIGRSRQVIAITHLPQVAALGETGYSIVKEIDDMSTYTTIVQLNEEERVYEIARLLSGEEITDLALDNAKILLGKK